MKANQYKKFRKLKYVLLSVVVIAVGIIIVVYMGYRRLSDAPQLLLETLQDGADMSIGKIHQTATRDGKREWSLEAESAHYMEDKKEVILKDLSVTFYLDNGDEVYLTAQRGVLNTGSNDIEVSGNVIIKKGTYRLTTEKLNYENKRRIIFTSSPILLTGKDARVSANSASLDLNTNTIRLKGSVESTISEKKPL
ncbi:MAG: LPS export ABC transporter periplasmic protein LptC [Deltaproteobacteria bacterium]|jgi:LPS export ABC transporter protein LptC|nr:LPS export ABC transporter periplasmic protein LptC [Deltaproteobacteria bacterium]